jgi:DNA repair protein RAD50
LKYITTGDLPPNTKGGAFVHDPSIAGESVVMAEVLLRFKNLAGTKLIASRRLQVSKKKNTALTMKTLEGTLSYNDDSSAPNSKVFFDLSLQFKSSTFQERVFEKLTIVVFCLRE